MHTHRDHTATDSPPDHYTLLGVARDADVLMLRVAYIELAREHYPNGGRRPNTRKFIEIKAAYDTLRNPLDRAAYDRKNPPQEKSGSDTETASGSTQGDSDSTTGSGTTETKTGSGAADFDSGTKGKAGASGIDTEPHPKSESKDRPKHHDNHGHHFTPRYSFEARRYPFSQSVTYDKYRRLRAMHVADAPRPVFRPNYRHRLHTLTLG